MSRAISVGIDVGSQHVKVVMVESVEHGTTPQERREAEASRNKSKTRVLGTGIADTKGVEHGYIVNSEEATKSVLNALKATEKSTGIKISRAYVGISGVGILGQIFHGVTNINKNDGEVTSHDVFRVQENARTEIPEALAQNRKVLHTFPLQYKIDGKTVLGHPEGLKGSKLEVKVLAVTSLTHHLNDLVNAIEDADIKVEDVIAGPVVVSANAISKAERRAGVVIANIGSESLSVIVYEDSMPISLEVFPIGSNDITNDIALGLKISLEEAEQVKLGNKQGLYPKKKIDEIINARLADIFELIENHLKKISKSGLLPAGIVLLGGGSKLPGIENFAKSYLKLPSRKIEEKTEWGIAYGVSMYGLFPDEIIPSDEGIDPSRKSVFKHFGHWVKQFLP